MKLCRRSGAGFLFPGCFFFGRGFFGSGLRRRFLRCGFGSRFGRRLLSHNFFGGRFGCRLFCCGFGGRFFGRRLFACIRGGRGAVPVHAHGRLFHAGGVAVERRLRPEHPSPLAAALRLDGVLVVVPFHAAHRRLRPESGDDGHGHGA